MSIAHIPVGVSGANSLYFVKLSPVPVPQCDSPASARTILPSHLEWGVLNGHSLQLLERVISLFYLPLLSQSEETSDLPASKPEAETGISEEFLVGLRKFASHLRRTIQQVEGDVKLRLPSVSPALLSSVDKCAADMEIIKQVYFGSVTVVYTSSLFKSGELTMTA